jgi:hypothetical protein
MLVMSSNQHEIEKIVEELKKFSIQLNLRFNNKKSEILTNESVTEIGGVKCAKVDKYLEIKVEIYRKEQNRVTREQIDKNIKIMRWRLGTDVIQ